MSRWLLFGVLLVLVVASGVALVGLKHQGRLLFIELERQARTQDSAQVEWSRLQLELAWLGETGRIEQQAVQRLDMQPPQRVDVLVTGDG
ncbi:MAG: cell division protein FtsL [Wenzhouxiangellaceae bacterium]|nr:cell division protein FtsL [Wenzhouxiangellaceae bacterium]